MSTKMSWIVACLLAMGTFTHAQTPIDVGSDGSDGVFTFVPDTPGGSTMTVDLALAASGLDGGGQPITWQTPSPVPGRGVYDPFVWSVVFKYSSVDVPINKTVQFSNHPSGAPVVWLVQTTTNIQGIVRVGAISGAEPVMNPGGFRPGRPTPSGIGHAGFGPGASPFSNETHYAGHATCGSTGPCYGSAACFPLIGGSGGGGWSSLQGAGGGAILIASGQSLALGASSRLSARAYRNTNSTGVGGGSGGTIRLVSAQITKSDTADLNARSFATGTGDGRIRFETHQFLGIVGGFPTPTLGSPGQLLPDATTPAVRVASVSIGGSGVAVPTDPRAVTDPHAADVSLPSAGTATVLLEARNVAPGRTCTVRVLSMVGNAVTYTSTPLSGTQALSTATVSVPLASGVYAMQARVVL